MPDRYRSICVTWQSFQNGIQRSTMSSRLQFKRPIEHHEQNNDRFKNDSGLMDNPKALSCRMVARLAVARAIMKFEANMHPNSETKTQYQVHRKRLLKTYIQLSWKSSDIFVEDSPNLLVQDTREIADPAVLESVRTTKMIRQKQFQTYSIDCLIDRT